MSFNAHAGYEAAESFDKVADFVLREYDPTDKNNQAGYLAYIRTVQTTLNIMAREAGLEIVQVYSEPFVRPKP